MSTVPKGGLILVTGVTGYIASWTALYLLEAGYRVRGTARTLSKADYLKQNALSKYADKFEIVQVNDLQDKGAFDEAVKGVDGIAHIASPFHFNVQDPYNDLINPAVNGTLNLLNAAKDYAGSQLKHVVITSSFASIMEPHDAPYTYTESDWNDFSIKEVENKGKDANPGDSYRASKSLAERALWKFKEENNPSFGLSAINPPFVFGPIIHDVKDADSINTSVALLFKYFSGQNKEIQAQTPVQSFVDVRDVAKAHVRALEREDANGKRFLTSSASFSWDDVVEVLRKEFPDRKDNIPEPTGKKVTVSKLDNSRAKEVLGIDFIGLDQSVKETAKSLEKFL